MSVQRYDTHYYDEPDLDMVDEGKYVLHSDYAALEARCAGLEATLLELSDRIGEGIGHKFESWEMAAFLRELRSEIRAALADTTPDEVRP